MKLCEYLRAAGMAGLDVREAMLMPPGVVFDMLDLMAAKNKKVVE